MSPPPYNQIGDISGSPRNRYAMKEKPYIWEVVKKQIVGRFRVVSELTAPIERRWEKTDLYGEVSFLALGSVFIRAR